MKIRVGVLVRWSDGRAEKSREGIENMSGLKLEFDGPFLHLKDEFEHLDEAIEMGRNLRQNMAPIGGGLVRELIFWFEGTLGPVGTEEALLRQAQENRRLKEELDATKKLTPPYEREALFGSDDRDPMAGEFGRGLS